MKVSIITPTVRKEGLDVVRKSLEKQTHKNWEWLVCSPFDPGIPGATWLVDDFKGGFWSLNRVYNRLIERATSPLIISWQDNIWIPADGVEKFVVNCGKLDRVISGVGDQYERVGKWGKPEIKIWNDPRKTDNYGSFYEINWNDCEWNWAAIPKKFLLDIGGMDERLDFLGFGGDQYQVCERLNDRGIRFYIDQTNESYTVRHTRDSAGGQSHWDANHVLFNGAYNKRKNELIARGKWPVLDYLKIV